MEADRVNFGRNVPRHLVEENQKQMGKNQKMEVLSTLFLTKQRGKNARAGGGTGICCAGETLPTCLQDCTRIFLNLVSKPAKPSTIKP